ncbi:hypothetical protein A6E01_20750 (plasmid) [Vibrio breoganii]|uniref:Uncharacterized protein n=2 Tax=Vibrio TaxID=662 RepID=A0AAN1CUF1_9VIBR|nr:hypothetical protein [Vibrio breoganii]ANO35643.1 hypothetical protein A6E01_20750 [Vibrio breoganii]
MQSEITSTDTTKDLPETLENLKSIKHRFEQERDTHYRLSNEVISTLLQMKPTSWRIFEQIVSNLDVYPTELMNNDGFIGEWVKSKGKTAIPQHFRTIEIKAIDYATKWKLPRNNAYRQFTKDCLALFNETLSNVSLGPYKNTAELTLSRVVSDVTFHARPAVGEDVVDVKSSLIKISSDDERENTVWQCHSATFVLNETLAANMLFLRTFFTRIEKQATAPLSKQAMKMYTLISMIAAGSKPVDGGWKLSWDLSQCNALTGTEYSSIALFAANFRLSTELSKYTEFDVIHSKDKASRDGLKYTKLNIFFSKKASSVVPRLAPSQITRKLYPRPRVLAGSAAEGVWARKNIVALERFREDLALVGRILPKADRERLARYKKIIGEL